MCAALLLRDQLVCREKISQITPLYMRETKGLLTRAVLSFCTFCRPFKPMLHPCGYVWYDLPGLHQLSCLDHDTLKRLWQTCTNGNQQHRWLRVAAPSSLSNLLMSNSICAAGTLGVLPCCQSSGLLHPGCLCGWQIRLSFCQEVRNISYQQLCMMAFSSGLCALSLSPHCAHGD